MLPPWARGTVLDAKLGQDRSRTAPGRYIRWLGLERDERFRCLPSINCATRSEAMRAEISPADTYHCVTSLARLAYQKPRTGRSASQHPYPALGNWIQKPSSLLLHLSQL